MVFTYDPKLPIETFCVRLGQPGFVPVYLQYDGKIPPLLLPEVKEVRLQAGSPIGGIVRDDSGKPVEDAILTISLPATEASDPNQKFTTRRATDESGRWRFDEAPADLTRATVRVEHRDFREARGELAPGLDSVTAVLSRGLTLSGSVVGPDGQPVANAHVLMGDNSVYPKTTLPEASTDAQGRFTLTVARAGAAIVTVQADGFAPALQTVPVQERGPTEPVAFRLEPAATLRLRVVDVFGKPVAQAYLTPQSWRGHDTLEVRASTDADGRLTWASAPRDAVEFRIEKDKFMSRSDFPLTATAEEQVVVLHTRTGDLGASHRQEDRRGHPQLPHLPGDKVPRRRGQGLLANQ